MDVNHKLLLQLFLIGFCLIWSEIGKRDQATSCYSTPSNFRLNTTLIYRETLPESKPLPPLPVQYQVPSYSVRHSNKMRLEEKSVSWDIIQHHASKREKSLCRDTEFKREDTNKHDRITSQKCQSITFEEKTLKEEEEERYLQLGETDNEEFNNDDCKQRHPEKFLMKSISTQSLTQHDHGLRTDNELVCNIDEIKEIREENIHKKTASRIRRKSLQVFNLGNKKLTDRKQSSSLSSINSYNETKVCQNREDMAVKKDCEKSEKRKKSKHSRKDSVDNTQRKTSLSGAIRAAISGRKKSERKNSDAKLLVDFNDNKLPKLESLRDKIKFSRRSSRSGTPNESPKFFHRPRTESVSSVGSNVRSLSNSFKRYSSTISLSSSFDARSMISLNNFYEEDAVKETQCSIPYQKFQLWGNRNTISQTSHETLPLLHVACAEGNVKLVNILIDCGVDVNETDQDGWPAIHYAVCAGYFECADKLISHGAKLKSYSNIVMNTYCQEIRHVIQYDT